MQTTPSSKIWQREPSATCCRMPLASRERPSPLHTPASCTRKHKLMFLNNMHMCRDQHVRMPMVKSTHHVMQPWDRHLNVVVITVRSWHRSSNCCKVRPSVLHHGLLHVSHLRLWDLPLIGSRCFVFHFCGNVLHLPFECVVTVLTVTLDLQEIKTISLNS